MFPSIARDGKTGTIGEAVSENIQRGKDAMKTEPYSIKSKWIFGDLLPGDCYRSEGSSVIYMKLKPASGDGGNAVVVESGHVFCHGGTLRVVRVEGHFIETGWAK